MELFGSKIPDILVSPSIMRATFLPNCASISCKVIAVSSTTSCNNAHTIEVVPKPISSAAICATAIGWYMYGSPDLRRISLWLSNARSNALRISCLSPRCKVGLQALSRARYLFLISLFSASISITYSSIYTPKSCFYIFLFVILLLFSQMTVNMRKTVYKYSKYFRDSEISNILLVGDEAVFCMGFVLGLPHAARGQRASFAGAPLWGGGGRNFAALSDHSFGNGGGGALVCYQRCCCYGKTNVQNRRGPTKLPAIGKKRVTGTALRYLCTKA